MTAAIAAELALPLGLAGLSLVAFGLAGLLALLDQALTAAQQLGAWPQPRIEVHRG